MNFNYKKYHGLGNDFIIIDERKLSTKPSSFIKQYHIKNLCDRNFGIGADGIIFIQSPEVKGYIRMTIFNSDGTEAEMCGNGLRCFILYLVNDEPNNIKQSYKVETKSGILTSRVTDNKEVVIDMGIPKFAANEIPTLLPSSATGIPQGVIDVRNKSLNVYAVGMGNPHVITIVDKLENIPFEDWGPQLENNKNFPFKTNVHFIQIINRTNIKVKVWERGCGPTLACGTGACACLAILRKLDLAEANADVYLPGGKLHISWPKSEGSIYMRGPAKYIYSGNFDLNNFDNYE